MTDMRKLFRYPGVPERQISVFGKPRGNLQSTLCTGEWSASRSYRERRLSSRLKNLKCFDGVNEGWQKEKIVCASLDNIPYPDAD